MFSKITDQIVSYLEGKLCLILLPLNHQSCNLSFLSASSTNFSQAIFYFSTILTPFVLYLFFAKWDSKLLISIVICIYETTGLQCLIFQTLQSSEAPGAGAIKTINKNVEFLDIPMFYIWNYYNTFIFIYHSHSLGSL